MVGIKGYWWIAHQGTSVPWIEKENLRVRIFVVGFVKMFWFVFMYDICIEIYRLVNIWIYTLGHIDMSCTSCSCNMSINVIKLTVFWFFVLFVSGFLASPWFSWTERRYTWQKRPRFNAEKRKLEGLSKQRLAVCMIKWFLYQSVGMSTRSLLSFQTMALCQGGCSQSMSIWLFFCPLFFCMLQCCPFFLPSTSFQLRSCPFTIFWTSLYFCTLDFPFPLVKLRKRGHVPCLSHGPRPRPILDMNIFCSMTCDGGWHRRARDYLWVKQVVAKGFLGKRVVVVNDFLESNRAYAKVSVANGVWSKFLWSLDLPNLCWFCWKNIGML